MVCRSIARGGAGRAGEAPGEFPVGICVTLYGDFLTWCLWEPCRTHHTERVLYGLSQRSRSLFVTLWVWGFPSWEARTAPVSRLMSAQGDWTPCTGLSTSISAYAQEAWWLDQLDFDDSCSSGNSRDWPTDRSRTWEAGEPSPYTQDSTAASTSLAAPLHVPPLHHAVWQCAQHLEWSHWWDFTLDLVAISFISKGISQRSQVFVVNLLHNQTLMQTHNCLKPWEATNHLQHPELSNNLLTIFSKQEEVGLSRPKQARLQSVPEGKQCQELPGTHTPWLGRRPVKGLFSCSKTFIYRVMSLKCMGCNSRNSATNLLNFLKYLLGPCTSKHDGRSWAHKEKLEFLPSNSHGNKQKRKSENFNVSWHPHFYSRNQSATPDAPSAGGKVIRSPCKQGIWRADQSQETLRKLPEYKVSLGSRTKLLGLW